MKYTREPFAVSAEYRGKILNKVAAYRREFKTRKAIHVALVSASGLRYNANSDVVQAEIRLQDLFS
jgi:hypothetical protein